MAANLWLLLRNISAIILFPGMATGYFPYLIIRPVETPAMTAWSVHHYGASLLILLGLFVLLASIWSFASVGRGTLAPYDETRRLVVTGLHRYVRNPMYIGVVLMLLGESWFFQSLILLVYTALIFVLFNAVIIVYEENRLRVKYGEEYRRYTEMVGRWIPRRPR